MLTVHSFPRSHFDFSEKSDRRAERQLSDDMVRFVNTEVAYATKRLLAADQKVLYVGPSGHEEAAASFTGPNPFSDDDGWSVCEDDKYGGLRLSPYLTYDW